MITEKFRYYAHQSILNILAANTNWATLTYGALACPNPNITAWGQVLKDRKSLFLKNQGLSNDNSTAGTIEIYFGQYHIDHIEKMITYDATTNTYTVDIGLGTPLTPTSNRTYLMLEPFSASVGSDVSDRNTISAVLRNVVNTSGTIYTFQLDGYELLVAAAAISAWTPVAAWAYTTKWTHTAGTATSLVAAWTPTIGEKYKIQITNVTTTPGTGYYITCGGITFPVVTTSGTTTYWVDAETAGALTFVLGAGGTWAGDITAVSVETYDHKVNTLLQNNIATKPVDFYDYTVPALVSERGILLATGESYSGDITHDVILYYKGSVQNQTLIVQQFC